MDEAHLYDALTIHDDWASDSDSGDCREEEQRRLMKMRLPKKIKMPMRVELRLRMNMTMMPRACC